MGVLDDAIRDHLDLKRRHGASEQELKRQEAEALGPARREPTAGTDVNGDAAGPGLDEQSPASGEDAPGLFDQTADSAAFERETDPSAAGPSAAPGEEDEAADLTRAVGVAPEDPAVDEVPAEEALEGDSDVAAAEAVGSAVDDAGTERADDDGEAQPPSDEEIVAAEPRANTGTAGPSGWAENQPSPEDEDTDELLIEYEDELLSDDELLEEDEEEIEEAEGQAESDASDPSVTEDRTGDEPPGDVEVVEGGLAEEELTREELAEEGLAGDDVLEETPDFLQEAPEDERLWFEQQPPRDFDLDR